nr:MAG TPA: hypothetical protein [Caudoviricetes sp.]
MLLFKFFLAEKFVFILFINRSKCLIIIPCLYQLLHLLNQTVRLIKIVLQVMASAAQFLNPKTSFGIVSRKKYPSGGRTYLLKYISALFCLSSRDLSTQTAAPHLPAHS